MTRIAAVLILVLFGAERAPETAIRGMKHPALSPDGTRIAFSYHGDIWVCPSAGGKATRLTDDPADEQKPAWSPDGKKLAFSSDKNGTRDIFILDLDTKEAKQLTYHSSDDDAPAWSPDGKWIAFQSNRDSNMDLALNDNVFDIWRMPAAGGTATRVTRFRGENPAWSPDGQTIAYDRYSSGYGDGEHNIFIIASDGSGLPKELAAGSEDSRRPAFQGSAVFFSHEANGIQTSAHRNIWRTSTAGGALVQVTGLAGDHCTWPTACQKTDQLVFVYDYELWSIRTGVKPAKPEKLKITIDSPYEDQELTKTYTSGARMPAWSPDGKSMAFILEGDVWTVSAAGGDAKQITKTLDEETDVSWSSDGGSLVYVSRPWGLDGNVYRISATGGEPERLTSQSGSYRNPRLCANHLAVAHGDALDLLDVRSKGKETIADASSPCFSPDGTALAYVSHGARIFIQDLAKKRTREEPSDEKSKSGLVWSPDGKKLAYAARERNGENIYLLDLSTGKATACATKQGTMREAPSWAPDSSMFVHEEARANGNGAGATQLVVRDATDTGSQLPLSFRATRRFTLKSEMLALFEQVWNAYWNRYYDPYFHGADWKAVKERFAPLAVEARTSAEAHELLNDMIRQLHSSHVHLAPPPRKAKWTTYSLGADFEIMDDGRVAIARVEPNSPSSGLEKGDVLVAVGETDVNSGVDLDRLFSAEGAASELTIAIRNKSNEVRTKYITGISTAALRALKYENGVERNRTLVKEKSGGKLCYFHIKYMGIPEVTRLRATLELENKTSNPEGLVFDIRDGVGGMAHRPIIQLLDSTAGERLSKKPACFMRNRDGSMSPDRFPATTSGKSWDKPVIMVQNEVARSDKEILPYTFMAAKVGYTVGMPTAGGVIGGNDWPMRDGSRITVSTQGWFTADGRNMEGWGVPPDFRVPMTHEALYAGRDPQLERAVEVLSAQLEGKIKPPREPKSSDRSGDK